MIIRQNYFLICWTLAPQNPAASSFTLPKDQKPPRCDRLGHRSYDADLVAGPNVRFESKPEKLNASKCFPLCPQQRTFTEASGTSAFANNGQEFESMTARSLRERAGPR
jgi:hypothetical protein